MSIHGTVNHSTFYNIQENSYFSGDYNIRRSIFMGDFIYAVSAQGVTVTNLTTMEEAASLALVYEEQCYFCAEISVDSSEGSPGLEESDDKPSPEENER